MFEFALQAANTNVRLAEVRAQSEIVILSIAKTSSARGGISVVHHVLEGSDESWAIDAVRASDEQGGEAIEYEAYRRNRRAS